jgi:hypothetical protein
MEFAVNLAAAIYRYRSSKDIDQIKKFVREKLSEIVDRDIAIIDVCLKAKNKVSLDASVMHIKTSFEKILLERWALGVRISKVSPQSQSLKSVRLRFNSMMRSVPSILQISPVYRLVKLLEDQRMHNFEIDVEIGRLQDKEMEFLGVPENFRFRELSSGEDYRISFSMSYMKDLSLIRKAIECDLKSSVQNDEAREVQEARDQNVSPDEMVSVGTKFNSQDLSSTPELPTYTIKILANSAPKESELEQQKLEDTFKFFRELDDNENFLHSSPLENLKSLTSPCFQKTLCAENIKIFEKILE